MPLAARILVGLVIGAGIGLALPEPGVDPRIDQAVATVGLGGGLWLQALQMTILPLVFSLIATLFVRSQGLAGGGRTTRRAMATIMGLYFVGVVAAVIGTIVLLEFFPVSEAIAQAMRAMTGEEIAGAPLPWADAILSIIPTNIVAAMGGDTLLPVLFFTMLFSAALSRLEDGEPRRVIVAGLTAISETMFIIVDWVLQLAPIGVALLILPTTFHFGATIFNGLAHFVALKTAIVFVVGAALYLVTAVFGRVPVGRFSRTMLPVQAVAFGTQSSTGCMPLTLKACRHMGISDEAADSTVPLAAILFRICAPGATLMLAAYAAQVYGLPMGLGLMITIALLAVLLEMSVVGMPGAAVLVATVAPIVALVGFPLAFLGVVIVVEMFSDVFGTMVNATGHAAASNIVDRRRYRDPPDTEAAVQS
ncbi:cation:dicarboxylase symporter family transporter [Altererythrobacter salegens]|uniref:Cation:dicarboxylase symporter family transporter n=1 Tax=Croceibacterium salegens TaxID=1737568 RepID=A0A6I4SZA8_9SPHN|nr:cation:dicarboxylase symporter family transporter [Croceibacterium salegens]MXO61183.1 cation:dicarboxylase symporter family transporter [Croceibacterium salegens]